MGKFQPLKCKDYEKEASYKAIFSHLSLILNLFIRVVGHLLWDLREKDKDMMIMMMLMIS